MILFLLIYDFFPVVYIILFFFRVPVQNERYDDWSHILVQLRRIFQDYLNVVLKYHARPNQTIPAATNSTAAQGNFLEVLNMSLNGTLFSNIL